LNLLDRAAPIAAFHDNDEREGPKSTARLNSRENQVRWAATLSRQRHVRRRSRRKRLSNLDHIRSYYRALNTGDPELVASHFTDDAVHYYTRLGPHEGARAIGENTEWAVENLEGQWQFEHGIEQGDEAVIEWTMTWRDPKSGEGRINRGTEWFRFRDARAL